MLVFHDVDSQWPASPPGFHCHFTCAYLVVLFRDYWPHPLTTWEQDHLSGHARIVNNFHGQNPFQFHGQTHIFMVKTDIFVLRSCKFSWSVSSPSQWQNFMLKTYSIPMTISCSKPIPLQWQNFMLKTYSIPMAKCSTPFHSSRISDTRGQPRLPAYLRCFRQFEPSLGTATKAILHRWSRVTR